MLRSHQLKALHTLKFCLLLVFLVIKSFFLPFLQYYQIGTVPLGTYNYTKMVNGTDPPQVQLCYSYYAEGGIINNTYVFDPNITEGKRDC